MSQTPRLVLRGITKQYPAVRANDSVGLTVMPGQIHAVLGENGAGKSTLMKIIYGAVQPDAGQIEWNGERVTITSPAQARALGISMVYQHFSLFDTLTAAENVLLGLGKSMGLMEVIDRIRAVAGEYGLDVNPLRPVHTLSVGERQRVEIVRALLTRPKLLILDEPTSVLTPQAVDKLFVTLRKLAEQGCSILYISHKLDEIRALCHHCTVLRGGKVTGEVDPAQESNASLSRLMIGSEPPALTHRPARPGALALEVRGLSLAKQDPFGMDLRDVSLDVRAGEIVGIAGVSGNGQQELMASLSGEDPRGTPGSVMLFGRDVSRASPRALRRQGMHFVPEERLGRGAVPTLSLAHNVLLTRTEGVDRRSGWLNMAAIRQQAAGLIERFNVKAGGPEAAAKSLSGGNLQKYIVGREIEAGPKLLLISQPTWGVDVGAAAQIRGELLALRDAGCAVLVVSEELDELFEICDRLVVIAQGRLSPSIATAQASVERIGEWMSGLWPEPVNRSTAAIEGELVHAQA
ncbi:ABC transporter-related protein [Leptothrix cholodnii SP-6]|uniref:ABC transporter-related protein n=1 Tax=Leptothrix cholodnii (strain ATCC 51168 / LMG 8142 / SP-6) TaxID=395495 RepID=B1Y3L2_LEPCP|nr:ABC transporter ATP-binding protein [Leptothrix cholodnii]ACB35715.1 ABC transporter-related protein [Leptothrix cholodnii SP-6]